MLSRKQGLDRDSGDCLLPVQYYELIHRRTALEGERKLMFAVLQDAIHCYLKNMNYRTSRQRSLFLEAQQWFDSSCGPKRSSLFDLFDFENVCQVLAIGPNQLRERLNLFRLNSQPTRRNRRGPLRTMTLVRGASGDLATAAGEAQESS
jgi:hypothetical protein